MFYYLYFLLLSLSSNLFAVSFFFVRFSNFFLRINLLFITLLISSLVLLSISNNELYYKYFLLLSLIFSFNDTSNVLGWTATFDCKMAFVFVLLILINIKLNNLILITKILIHPSIVIWIYIIWLIKW